MEGIQNKYSQRIVQYVDEGEWGEDPQIREQ